MHTLGHEACRKVDWMPRLAAMAALAASVAAGCGRSGGPTGPTAAPAAVIGAVDVVPAAGPVGTEFTLAARGLREGEAVAFEITFPDKGKAFPGGQLSVPADGTATTTYRATTVNPPGPYVVRLTGPPGGLAEGRFTVTGGPPVTSAAPTASGPTTVKPNATGRTGTTKATSRTTSTRESAGSSTTSGSTTRPSTTTVTTGSSTSSTG